MKRFKIMTLVVFIIVFSTDAIFNIAHAVAPEPWVDIRAYNGDLVAACKASHGKKVIVSSPTATLLSSFTTPADVEIEVTKGGMISTGPNPTLSLNINGPFSAGLYQVFSGNGAVAGLKTLYPQWFGAKGDGVSDDSAAVRKTFSLLANNTNIVFPPGMYLTNGALINKVDTVYILGYGAKLKFNGGTGGSIFTISGRTLADYATNIFIEGLTFSEANNKQFYGIKLYSRWSHVHLNSNVFAKDDPSHGTSMMTAIYTDYTDQANAYGLFLNDNFFHRLIGCIGGTIAPVTSVLQSHHNYYSHTNGTAIALGSAGIVHFDEDVFDFNSLSISTNGIGPTLTVKNCYFESGLEFKGAAEIAIGGAYKNITMEDNYFFGNNVTNEVVYIVNQDGFLDLKNNWINGYTNAFLKLASGGAYSNVFLSKSSLTSTPALYNGNISPITVETADGVIYHPMSAGKKDGNSILKAIASFVTVSDSSPTSVTTIASGNVNQLLTVRAITDMTTFIHGRNLVLKGAANYHIPIDGIMVFLCIDGTKWIELSRNQ